MQADPVKFCKLHKEQGCAHVDGFLCKFNSCEERYEYVKQNEEYIELKEQT